MSIWRFFFISLILLIVEIILVVVFVPLEMINEAIIWERDSYQKWFGFNKTSEMITSANTWFDSAFIQTGIAEEFNSWFYHDQDVVYENNGIQAINDSAFFTHFYQRLEQFWLVLKFSMLRSQMIMISMILALTFIIPALVDGLMIRQVARYGDENVSINLYNFAEFTLYGCAVLPLYLIFSPIPISPLVMVPYSMVLAGSVWVLSSNVQHRI